MSVILIWLLIGIGMCYFLPIDQQIENEGWFYCQSWLFLSCISQCWCRSKMSNELYLILWLLQKIVTEITRYHWFEICDKNYYKWHIRNIHTKYIIIIIVHYTIAEDLDFVVQYHESYNKININHSPSQFSL